jgi:hypothetical protein
MVVQSVGKIKSPIENVGPNFRRAALEKEDNL